MAGQKTESHRLQLGVCMLQLKMPHAATKIQCSQTNNKINLKNIKKLPKQRVTFMYTIIKKSTRMFWIPEWKADFH